jgi:hypothetical protein
MIPEGGSVDVTVTINSSANNAARRRARRHRHLYQPHTGDGTTDRDLTLKVGVPIPVYMYDLSSDPGWTTAGPLGLRLDRPAAAGSTATTIPTSAATAAATVYGYNLSGDYENYLSEKSSHHHRHRLHQPRPDVSVKFWRYLNVEQPQRTITPRSACPRTTAPPGPPIWTNQSARSPTAAWQPGRVRHQPTHADGRGDRLPPLDDGHDRLLLAVLRLEHR